MTELLHLADLDDEALAAAYAPPRTPWLRLNFVSTVDGAVHGEDGRSKSINNEADGRVFRTLRWLADVVVVGAGTVRTEEYEPNPKPLVVVTRQGAVPPSLLAGDLSQVYVATGASAPALGETRELLGDRALVLGESEPDVTALRDALLERGFRDLLCEGGPQLAADLLTAGLVDELCLTTVPRLLGGDVVRGVAGDRVDVELRLAGLVEEDGTLLARWFVA